jgi:hypothetical protein
MLPIIATIRYCRSERQPMDFRIAWRERIGNAVQSDAAAAIASIMGHTRLLAATARTFMLSNMPILVRPVAVALAVKGRAP